jgi:pimeloyl-ACP methyl ester carboxylesterase
MTKMKLILHGALGSAGQMKSLFPPEDDLIFIDFPGHGNQADNDIPFHLGNFADHVLGLPFVQNAVQIEIFGYSMGGYVALLMAARQPEKITGITTLGTKFYWSPDIAAAEVRMLNPAAMEEKVPKFTLRLRELHGEHWKEVVRKTAKMMTELGNTPLLPKEELEKITCPVLVTRGDGDNMVSDAETRDLAALLPQGEYKCWTNTPHPVEKVDRNILLKCIANQKTITQ